MKPEQNEPMKYEYYVRWCKNGKWQSLNINELTEKEFRNWLMHYLRFVGLKKDES